MPQKSTKEEMERVVEGAKQEVEASRQPWYYLSRAARLLLVGYAVILAVFGLLAWWVHVHPIVGIDVWITQEFQEDTNPLLHTAMFVVSYPGSTSLLSLLVLFTALGFWVVRLRLEAVVIVVLYAVTGFLNALLKILVDRPRPTDGLVEVFQNAAGASFPSGHVMGYVAFWGLLFSFGVILFSGFHWWRVLLLIVSGLFVVLVGPSRIYLGDHWATDVLGAYLIGGVLLGVTLGIYLRLKESGVLQGKQGNGDMTWLKRWRWLSGK